MKRENPFLNIYKQCNSGTNMEKYEAINSGKVQLPTYLDVELTNYCNFRCCFCPTGTKSMKRMRGYMSDDVIDALVYNVRKYNIYGVRLIRWGEPTMHPKWIEVIQRLKNAGTMVHINTNGSFINVDNINKLLDSGLDSLKFSFQGADEGTYNEMREGGDYKKLLNVIQMLYSARGERLRPYIQISTTLTGETIEQIDSFLKDVSEYCDYYNIGYTMLTHLNVEDMKIDENEKQKIRLLQENEKINHKYLEVCPEAFDKLSINWNGDVTLCCSDYDNDMIIGNILDMDIRQLFLSRSADNYRKIIANKEYKKINCCSTCYETVPLIKK